MGGARLLSLPGWAAFGVVGLILLVIADDLIVMDRGEVMVAGPASDVNEAVVKRYLTV